MKKRKLISRIMCSLVAILTAVSFLAPAVQAKTTYSFNVSLNAGINNQLLVGYGAPFYVTVENTSSSNFEGQLQMIVPGKRNENIMYARDISLGVNEKKIALFNAGLSMNAPFVNIRLANKKGKVEYETLVSVAPEKEKKAVRVGVMTDDFSAVSYMDRQHFLFDDTYYTQVSEITKYSLCEVGRSLDMYDVIVISDFSTDILSDKQIEALQSWTAEGGFLIIGTGSTANKTMSGFDKTFVDAVIGDSEDVITTLGMMNADYSYVNELQNYASTVTSYYSPYTSMGSSAELDEMYRYKYYNWYYPEDYDLEQGAWMDSSGKIYDDNGKAISPDYYYLFDEDAFYTDPLTGEIHYKYYDVIYGVPDSSDYTFNSEYDDYAKYDSLDDYCLEEYFDVLGYDVNRLLYDQGMVDEYDRQQEFDRIWGADYEDFCYHHIWGKYNYEYYGLDVRTDIWSAGTTTDGYSSISANIREVTLEGANSNLEIFCDVASTGETKSIGKIENIGDGFLGVFGIDFTKNPIPKTAYAGDFFRSVVEKTIGKTIILESENYDGDSYYSSGTSTDLYSMDTEVLYDLMSSAPVPPSLLYILLLAIFLIFVLVIYIVLAKKKKTRKLWVIYPISAAVTLVLIFCISFSTRLLRMNVNTVALINPNGNVTTEEDYIAVVTPKKKKYSIDFSKDISIDQFATGDDYSYYYYSASDIDYDKYKTVYYEGLDKIESVIENEIPLSSTNFKAKTNYLTNGGLKVNLNASPDIISVGPSTIRITNDYSTDMEDVFVIYTGKNAGYGYSNCVSQVRYFGKIKAGEEVTMLSGKEYDGVNSYSMPQAYNDYLILDQYDENHLGKGFLTFVFGELLPSNREYLKRRGILNAAFDYTQLDENSVYVIGFPKGQIGSDMLEDKFTKENKYETVVIYESADDLEVVY